MNKKIICILVSAACVVSLAACSKSNEKEPSTADNEFVGESVTNADYSSVKIDARVPMKATECDIFMDTEHNSEKTDGDTTLYYMDSELVMKKTYSAGKLASKSVYGDYQIDFTYTYTDDGKLERVDGSGEAGDGSFTKVQIKYRADSSIESYAFLSKNASTGKTELYSYDFDKNGNVTHGYDNYESFSEALNGAILGNFGLQ